MHPPKLHEISIRIAEILGLDFPKNRWNDLERGVLSAAKELGLGDSVEYLSFWLNSGKLGPQQLDVLANHLTVGETYFFREKHSLELFRNQIIPEIMAERFGKDQHINIWSAGCCSGEEPYTLAMILLETIPDISKWDISILATDLNPRFLKKAEEGIYSPWSFRETPKEMQSRYFHKVGSGWQIDETIQKMVDFKQFNLAEPEFSYHLNFNRNLDVIFCRNVLMYFSPALIRQVGLNFYNALRPQGWFITSPVELSDELFDEFAKVQFDKGIVYRKTTYKQAFIGKVSDYKRPAAKPVPTLSRLKFKKTMAEKPTKASRIAPVPEVLPFEVAERLYRNGQYAECAALCRTEMAKSGQKYAWQRIHARSCANIGQLGEALQDCHEMLKHDRLDADTYCLMATILAERQEVDEAVKVLNQVFYIEPDHLMSHLLMAGIQRRMGKVASAAIHLKKIKKILNGLEDHVVLDETEGLTVGRILGMVESQGSGEKEGSV